MTALLFGVFGRSVGFTAEDLQVGADINQVISNLLFRRTPTLDSSSSQAAIQFGVQLYDAIVVDGRSPDWIKNNTLSRSNVRQMRTRGALNDIRLWPWTVGSDALPTGPGVWLDDSSPIIRGMVRPSLFVSGNQMDLNPLSGLFSN